MRVLVVEDYGPLRESLVRGLSEQSFTVDSAGDGELALWRARDAAYDAIVLDLMLPKIDGLSVLRKLREAGSQTPVLILTARDTVDDRVVGLDAGADDYLIKPFAFEELLARLRALIRRKYQQRDPIVTIADLRIDTAAKRVWRGETEIDLTAREYAMLELLAIRSGSVVTRTEIWEAIYEFNDDASSNVVDVYIGYLRRKIEGDGLAPLIHTRRGQGYMLGEMS